MFMETKMGMSSSAVQSSLASRAPMDVAWAAARSPLVVGGLVAYVLGAGLWLLVLSKADLSLVYPFVALGFILTMLFGGLILGEAIGASRIVGTLLIAAGAILVARS
jgi:drug/metabolite transporter (DMT)-like permease